MKKVLLSAFAYGLSTFLGGQSVDPSYILKEVKQEGLSDVERYTEGYMQPLFNSFAANLSGSWGYGAQGLKKWGFDVGVSMPIALLPSSSKTFNFEGGKILKGTDNLPTVAGSKTEKRFEGGRSLNAINGTGLSYYPLAYIHVGIGLPYEIMIRVRFLPPLSISGLQVGAWGIAAQYNLSHLLYGNKVLPLSITFLAGYSQLSASYGISNSGKGEMSSWAFTSQLFISSIKLPIINFYGGLNLSTGATSLKLSGNYDATASSPFSLNVAGDKVLYGLTAGVRLKFIPLTSLTVDYTLQSIPVVSAGLTVAIRSR